MIHTAWLDHQNFKEQAIGGLRPYVEGRIPRDQRGELHSKR